MSWRGSLRACFCSKTALKKSVKVWSHKLNPFLTIPEPVQKLFPWGSANLASMTVMEYSCFFPYYAAAFPSSPSDALLGSCLRLTASMAPAFGGTHAIAIDVIQRVIPEP